MMVMQTVEEKTSEQQINHHGWASGVWAWSSLNVYA